MHGLPGGLCQGLVRAVGLASPHVMVLTELEQGEEGCLGKKYTLLAIPLDVIDHFVILDSYLCYAVVFFWVKFLSMHIQPVRSVPDQT
jgi:hypothetical protein